jgi:pyoverdine/dityrosine biosynthesis protein Dit1
VTQLAIKILDVLEGYSKHLNVDPHSGPESLWPGKFKFLDRVRRQVESNEPIKMILPSFPWKSVSSLPSQVSGFITNVSLDQQN